MRLDLPGVVEHLHVSVAGPPVVVAGIVEGAPLVRLSGHADVDVDASGGRPWLVIVVYFYCAIAGNLLLSIVLLGMHFQIGIGATEAVQALRVRHHGRIGVDAATQVDLVVLRLRLHHLTRPYRSHLRRRLNRAAISGLPI